MLSGNVAVQSDEPLHGIWKRDEISWTFDLNPFTEEITREDTQARPGSPADVYSLERSLPGAYDSSTVGVYACDHWGGLRLAIQANGHEHSAVILLEK